MITPTQEPRCANRHKNKYHHVRMVLKCRRLNNTLMIFDIRHGKVYSLYFESWHFLKNRMSWKQQKKPDFKGYALLHLRQVLQTSGTEKNEILSVAWMPQLNSPSTLLTGCCNLKALVRFFVLAGPSFNVLTKSETLQPQDCIRTLKKTWHGFHTMKNEVIYTARRYCASWQQWVEQPWSIALAVVCCSLLGYQMRWPLLATAEPRTYKDSLPRCVGLGLMKLFKDIQGDLECTPVDFL